MAGEGILIIIFVIAAFFLGRQVMLWYWRVDEQILILKNIEAKVSRINDKLAKLQENKASE